MPTQQLTPEIITAAIQGFEVQKQHIDSKIAELRAMLSGGPTEPTVTPEPTKRKRRKISAAGRARIAEAQRKRWAESKRQAEQPSESRRRALWRQHRHAGETQLSCAGRRLTLTAPMPE